MLQDSGPIGSVEGLGSRKHGIDNGLGATPGVRAKFQGGSFIPTDTLAEAEPNRWWRREGRRADRLWWRTYRWPISRLSRSAALIVRTRAARFGTGGTPAAQWSQVTMCRDRGRLAPRIGSNSLIGPATWARSRT